MNKKKIGLQTTGIKLPIMRNGDDLINTVVDCVLEATEIDWSFQDKLDAEQLEYNLPKYGINNKDVIGITESLLGRCYGLYVTVQDIADETERFFGKDAEIWMLNAIYSRNRHSLILRGIAQACKKICFVTKKEDSCGNLWGVNPFTMVSIPDFYKQICEEEGCEFVVYNSEYFKNIEMSREQKIIDCDLHTTKHHRDIKENYPYYYFLTDYNNDKNSDFGLLGSNKANDKNGGTLKLFPTKELATKVCDEVKAKIKEKTGKDVIVCIYGDGCFHSPYLYDDEGNVIEGTSINEFADPVTMPGYTDKELIESTPNELKLKSVIDNLSTDAEVLYTINAEKEKRTGEGQFGTTPRIYRDLLASLMDLTSGSGDRATPVVLVQNYF